MFQCDKGQVSDRSHAEWGRRLERFSTSGCSVKDFCRAESISTASFYRWRRRLAAPDQAPPTAAQVSAFVDLGALGGEPPPAWQVELELGAGVVLRVRRG
jgi:hypothetical protein